VNQHPTLQQLLRAVLENPCDLDARRIYADWLEEYGDEEDAGRARMSRLPDGTPHTCTYTLHTCFLLLGEAPLNPPVTFDAFGRVRLGFIDEVTIRPPDFLRHARELFGRHPVTAVQLVGVDPEALDVTRLGDQSRQYHYRFRSEPWPYAVGVWRSGIDGNAPTHQECLRLAHLLDEEDRGGTYTSAEEALAAVSRALVRWGRELVELPPLPGPDEQVAERGE
jgi:uncharacterized protein (TIGR02996 family)